MAFNTYTHKQLTLIVDAAARNSRDPTFTPGDHQLLARFVTTSRDVLTVTEGHAVVRYAHAPEVLELLKDEECVRGWKGGLAVATSAADDDLDIGYDTGDDLLR